MNNAIKILSSSKYFCTQCSDNNAEHYKEWILELAELPLIYNYWDVGLLIYNLEYCPQCKNSFKKISIKDNFLPYNIPSILEIVTFEAAEISTKKKLTKIPSILTEIDKNIYHDIGALNILSWIALAIASGILGNFTYEYIKKTVINTYKKIKHKRQKAINSNNFNKITKSELDSYNSLLMEWDSCNEDELKKRMYILNQYLRQRLKGVTIKNNHEES